MHGRRTTKSVTAVALALLVIGTADHNASGQAALSERDERAADGVEHALSPRPNAESSERSAQAGKATAGRVFHRGGIVNRASGKALDAQDQGTNDGANIQQWDFARQPNQMWNIVDQGSDQYAIISQASGKALDVTNHQANDGANIQLFGFAKVANQLWKIQPVTDGYYQIVSLSSGKCLDVELGKINDNGANVQQWSCAQQPNQQWQLVK
jgi:hypothetical protein